jgi:hypothetical protein
MGSKSKLAKAIVALQQRATAICDACQFKGERECQGALCNRVLTTVRRIDSLVSEYFRLELEERRGALRHAGHRLVWQRQLPFAGTSVEMMVQPQEPREAEAAADLEWHQLADAWTEVAAATLFGEAWVQETLAAPHRLPSGQQRQAGGINS